MQGPPPCVVVSPVAVERGRRGALEMAWRVMWGYGMDNPDEEVVEKNERALEGERQLGGCGGQERRGYPSVT